MTTKSKSIGIIIAVIIIAGLGTMGFLQFEKSQYDNNADVQYVSIGVNTESISTNNLASILNNGTKPLEKGKFADESILFPVKINTDEPIKIETDYAPNVLNPFTNEVDTIPAGKLITIPKAKTEIFIPIKDAEIFVFELERIDHPIGLGLQYFGPDGTRYVLRIPFEYREGFELMDTIKNAPRINARDLVDYNQNVQKGQGLSLPPGTTILKTTKNNLILEIDLDVYSSNFLHGKANCNYSFLEDDQTNKILCLPTQE
ncbi:MAG: hypothetical protein JW712_04795 [Dehalococcoidales bacterium]|nr:hypothetical protein [Dehalococcoidales bacterium]